MNDGNAYNSPLRREQAEQTRLRIVAATVRLIVGGVEGLTMQQVAAESGVALRTVFRHFATRDDLLDATWMALNEQMGEVPELRGMNDLTAFVPELFARYGRMEDQIRAVTFASTMTNSRLRRGSARSRAMRAAVEAEFQAGDERARAMAVATAYTLTIPTASILLKDNFKLSSDEAGRAVAWAIRVLAEAYAKDPEALTKKDPP